MPKKRPAPFPDPGAIFDGALERGLTLPRGLSPAAARKFYAEHAPNREATEQEHRDTLAMLWRWRRSQWDDPTWRTRRDKIAEVLQRAHAFRCLERNRLCCDPGLVRDKLLEALTHALGELRESAERREALRNDRKIAEGDLDDAISRKGILVKGSLGPSLFAVREATALAALRDVEVKEADRSWPRTGKQIVDDLTLDLFAIVRHVSFRALEKTSDEQIHALILTPILKAFAKVDAVVPRRSQYDPAPKQRVKTHLTAREIKSATDADVWRDGRKALSRAELVLLARDLLFSWDLRFDPALFANR